MTKPWSHVRILRLTLGAGVNYFSHIPSISVSRSSTPDSAIISASVQSLAFKTAKEYQ